MSPQYFSFWFARMDLSSIPKLDGTKQLVDIVNQGLQDFQGQLDDYFDTINPTNAKETDFVTLV